MTEIDLTPTEVQRALQIVIDNAKREVNRLKQRYGAEHAATMEVTRELARFERAKNSVVLEDTPIEAEAKADRSLPKGTK